MNKGLKALEELKFQVGNITYFTRDLQITTFKVRDSGLFEIIEKELKVLKIIKVKKVDVSALLELDNFTEYNDYCDMVGGCKKLTPEEYDLVREVL